jgi:formylglycine-generating enzyme required for sulfatase activity
MKISFTLLLILIRPFSQSMAQHAERNTSVRELTNELGMEFVLIEPGSMIVGRIDIECPSPPDTRDVAQEAKWTKKDYQRCEELSRRYSEPGFKVTIEEPFYIGKYEVTQELWEQVMGTNPSFFQKERVESNSGRHPVDSVTWQDVQAFIRQLNRMDTTAVYRLPTEFEWEYAARAGAEKLLSWAETHEQGWIADVNKGTTHPVGQKKPNAWGLCDTIGNVWEWVQDYYNEKVYPDPVPPKSGDFHVLRGGSFLSDVANATYFMHAGGPGNGYDVGFRIVREAK